MDGNAVSYDSNTLQNSWVHTTGISHSSVATKNANVYNLAHANRSAIPFLNFPSKLITLKGNLVGTSIVDMDGKVDTFKGYFNTKDKYLDIGYNGATRRYLCTPMDIQVEREDGLAHATFTITFICTIPFGRDTLSIDALNFTSRTLGIYADSATFLGNAPVQWPVITVTYSAITGGTNKAVSFSNNANGQKITITRTWAAGDVLQIDVPNRIVTVNTTEVDFTGAFPEFSPNGQSMTLTDEFTTRTFNYNVAYYPQWL